MRTGVGLWVVLGAIAVGGPAGAWGSQGHQVVGSVADHFLGARPGRTWRRTSAIR